MSWIDFRQLRTSLPFERVLDHYRVSLRINNGKATGFCPLPLHQGEKRSPSFSAQLAKGIFQCFGCGAKGNVLDFACLMEGKNPRHGPDVHQVAQDLQARFLDAPQRGPRHEPQPQRESRQGTQQPLCRSERETRSSELGGGFSESSTPVIINPPLDFQLKELDANHPYLKERGFSAETIQHFGLGYCNRGAFKGRVAIPLHDAAGQFIGYAGRITDDKLISTTCPKYKLPAPREHAGSIHELHKSLFLYNGHRLEPPLDDLLVVEGFPSVWWLWQHDYPMVVSLMGASCSPAQAQLIVQLVHPDGKVWVVTDGDDAGARCAHSVVSQVSAHRWVRWIRLNDGEQPTDCTVHDLQALFAFDIQKSAPLKRRRAVRSRSASNRRPSDAMAAEE